MNSTVTGNAETIKQILEKKHQYKECLFSRGYFITEDETVNKDAYPFYGQWVVEKINNYTAFIHKDQDYCVYNNDNISFLIVGHAYNPFNEVYEEKELLHQASEAYFKSKDALFDCVNEWTGIFALFVFDKNIIGVQDCAGIKALYYGRINEKVCFTSHPQLVADVYCLKIDSFIEKLVANRFYNIGNRYLPGDCSPFKELKRIGANVYLDCGEDKHFTINRFYPVRPLKMTETEEEYNNGIEQAYKILHKNIELASKKWPNSAISLSGGTDSKTTLACANGLYDKFSYFSFQSKDTEITDSNAAHEICEKVGIKHDIYPIPAENSEIEDYEELKAIIVHSYGYVRGLSESEIRKHICMYRWNYFDTEIKSWISEVVRVFFERKYGMSFPKVLTPRHFSIFQTRYFGSPSLLSKSDKIYKEYMKKFDLEKPKFNYEHTDMYYWEVRMSSWGTMVTQSLDICHRITFPFNNRKLVELMLTLPREYRKIDKAHNDIIKVANKDIYNSNIHILNNYFHSGRIMLEKAYFIYRTLFK
ncbi:MAG: 7-cyano-7-deazaguanine synthase [Clostridia bacterium]|nr:7-cyano-7-deazaguanine synthase [Clostridia bacterium]